MRFSAASRRSIVSLSLYCSGFFTMNDHTTGDDIREHLMQVGLVCSQWAYLEWLLELTHWWLLGLLNKDKEGRVITSGLSIEVMARRVWELCHLRISDIADRDRLGAVKDRIQGILEERNLAVHGRRSLNPDQSVTGAIARGKYKHEPQKLSLVRLRNLNTEIGYITAELEPILVRYGIIEGMTDLSAQLQSPPQET
jgi:hypothetical protein